MKTLLLVLALLLLPLTALAHLNDNCGWTDGAGNLRPNQSSMRNITPGSVNYFEWENSPADGTCSTSLFFVQETAYVYCNLDIGAVNTAAPGGAIEFRGCPSETRNDSTCVGTGILDGVEGFSSAQTWTVVLGRGHWFGFVDVAIPDGDEAICWIHGDKT